MKKIICLLLIVLMIASVAYAQKKMKIAAKDLPKLKGTWEGMLAFDVNVNCPAKLEILNDTVPIKGKLTVTDIPGQITQQLGITSGTHVSEVNDGLITSQGTIMWVGPMKNFFEFNLTGDKKGAAWFYFNGARGDVTLKKK
jgi:hypothetical protein